MFGLGMGELVIVGFIVVLLFGGNKLPQLGGALGKAMSNFKQGLREDKDEQNAIPESETAKVENEKAKKVFEV